ncbi:MAG: hypothetical protein ACOWWR_13525 [Eubacteriales bacterium]
MEAKIKELYDSRKLDIKKAIDFDKPERVPICTEVLYWPLDYAGVGIEDILGNPELHRDAFVKIFDDMYTDAIGGGGISVPLEVMRTIGSESYFLSNDGITIQHHDQCVMREDEYDEYMANPHIFPVNVLAKRKFKKLNESPDQIYKTLKKACLEMKIHNCGNSMIKDYLENEKGIVYFQGRGILSPLDYIFDYLRGFKQTIIDMRRNPEKLKEACEVVYELTKDLNLPENVKYDYPPVFHTPVHALPFINRKQFEEFWWKYYKPQVKTIVDAGGKIKIRGEGFCEFALDTFADEFPEGTFIWQFDQDNPYDLYPRYKDSFIFQCGIENNKLNVLKKEQCIDEAKKAVDTFAPGGGFIFSTSKIILCKNEVKAENLIAVHEFVHEYGKY